MGKANSQCSTQEFSAGLLLLMGVQEKVIQLRILGLNIVNWPFAFT
jgi:hypothetical protein